MSFLNNVESMVGNLAGGNLQRLASGQGNFQPGSPDHQSLMQMISHADPSTLERLFGQAAGQMNPGQYAQHVTPGASGTNPLGSLGGGGLSTIASLLIGHLMHGGGYSQQSLLSKIPGLQTTDPQQMNPQQVASVAQYTQQNHPGLFGRIAAILGKQHPDLLHAFLGQGGLSALAPMLAQHFTGK